MKKHAYLVLTHNNFYVLEKFLRLVDDERNDIYIHLDKKVKNFEFDFYRKTCKKSTVYFTKKRYNCNWGGASLVRAEMCMFEMAYEKGYDYYHLVSGADLPIKTQDYIHDFFDNNRYEFVEFANTNHNNYRLRFSRYHLNHTDKFQKKLIPYFDIIQNKLKVDRLKRSDLKIYKGSQWASLSNDGVKCLIDNKQRIFKLIRMSLCSDEIYKQTIIMDSPLKNRIYPNKDIRYIDWEHSEGESPHTLRKDDFEALFNSECLFARKFVKETDEEIIESVYNYLIK